MDKLYRKKRRLNQLSDKQPKKHDAVCLSESDMNILLSPTAWVNDKIVLTVKKLLKSQDPFINGFQDPSIGLTCAFDIEFI